MRKSRFWAYAFFFCIFEEVFVWKTRNIAFWRKHRPESSCVVMRCRASYRCWSALYNIVDQIFIANASYLGSFGNAANTVVFPMTVIALAIAVMIGDGCCAFVSLSLGKGRPEDASRSAGNAVVLFAAAGVVLMAIYLLLCEALVGAVGLILVEGFPRALIGIFGAANESVYYTDFALRAFRIYLCMLVLACVNKACFIFLQAMGKAAASTALSMVREIVFGVGFALLLPLFWGLDGVLWSMPVSDILTFAISAVLIVRTDRELRGEG